MDRRLRILCGTWALVGLASLPFLAASAQDPGARRPPAAGTTGPLVFAEPLADLDECYQFAVLEHAFEYVNAGDRPVRVLSVKATDALGRVEFERAPVAPGGTGSIRVRQPVGPKLGELRFDFIVETDDPAQSRLRLRLATFAQSPYDVELPFLNFEDVERALGKTVPLDLSSREIDRLELAQIVNKPAVIEVREAERIGVAGEQLRLEVRLVPEAPLGFQQGTIHLRTNVPHQPDLLVAFQASVYDDVVPSESPIQLGAVRLGHSFVHKVELKSRASRPFRVLRVEDDTSRFATQAESCYGAEGPSDCWLVEMRYETAEQGGVMGDLLVFLDDHGEPVPLRYTGMVASADAVIHDLGEVGSGTSVIRKGEDDE